ncbi:MAG: protein kinase [Planctomycetota bacterium]|nr:protein kinase [Planctomycetota bacterium]
MPPSSEPDPLHPIDWESFYANHRKPGYIPGFEIVNKLGGGVFGLVYKARKESIGKDYAIKFLKVDDEALRDAVLRELETVRYFAQIDHPNLVSIEDRGEVDGIPFIVMNHAGEGTLQTRLEEGRLSRDEALKIFVQAARGIQAIHDHSLVHFDIKPANIFMRGDIARVGDYGLSKMVTQTRNSLSFGRGTPYYMAPEILKQIGDARSDIYSLGIILYECLVGEVPFKGDTEWQVLHKHEHEAPEFPDDVGAVERKVIEKCLAKDPDDRYQSVTDLLRDLSAPVKLGESVILPPRGSTLEETRPSASAGSGGPPAAPEAKVVSRARSRRRGRLVRSKHKHAGFLVRFLACLIDGLITTAISAPLGYAAWSDFVLFDDHAEDPSFSLISLVIAGIYTIGFWVKKGATPGKMLFSIRVVDLRGNIPSLGACVVRYLGYILSGCVCLLGYLWMLWDPESQTWHDKMASTYVVQD